MFPHLRALCRGRDAGVLAVADPLPMQEGQQGLLLPCPLGAGYTSQALWFVSRECFALSRAALLHAYLS